MFASAARPRPSWCRVRDVVTLLPVLAALAAFSATQGQQPSAMRSSCPQLILFVMFVAAQAPEVVSRDLQHKVLHTQPHA